MKWNERNLVIKPVRRFHLQLYNVAKGTDVGELTIHVSPGWETPKPERAGVTGGRSRRVRKAPHPPTEEGTGPPPIPFFSVIDNPPPTGLVGMG